MQQHNKKHQATRFHFLLGIGLSTLSVLFNIAQAQQVTVNFTGTVTAANCTIQNGTAITVPLGTVKVSDFTAEQQEVTGSTRTVEVNLTNCPANSKITLQLAGEQDPSNPGVRRLKINSGPNMATGIAIAPRYIDSAGVSSWLGVGAGALTTQISADANGSAKFQIGGTLVKRAADIPVTAGQVMASMTMTLTVN